MAPKRNICVGTKGTKSTQIGRGNGPRKDKTGPITAKHPPENREGAHVSNKVLHSNDSPNSDSEEVQTHDFKPI